MDNGIEAENTEKGCSYIPTKMYTQDNGQMGRSMDKEHMYLMPQE